MLKLIEDSKNESRQKMKATQPFVAQGLKKEIISRKKMHLQTR